MSRPMQASISSPIFLQSAEDIVRRLGSDTSPQGAALVREARALVDTLRGWQSARPDDDVRVAVIQQLFDLNRRAMDHLARGGQAAHRPVASVDD